MFSIADLERATGLDRRTIQYWADKGGLRPTMAGDRRMFSRVELEVALVLKILAKQALPIRLVEIIGTQFRDLLSGKVDHTNEHLQEMLAEVRSGGGDAFVAMQFALFPAGATLIGIQGAATLDGLQPCLARWLSDSGLCPVTIINLGAALRAAEHHAEIAEGKDIDA